MSGINQGGKQKPLPKVIGGTGLVPVNDQSRGVEGLGLGTTTTTTVIRPSPGTTTEVIIRPPIVDGQPGRTQILRFPPTGDFQNIQVQQIQSPPRQDPNPIVQNPNPVVQNPNPVVQGQTPDFAQNSKLFKTPTVFGQDPKGDIPLSPLQAYPVTILSTPLPNQYNFQSQRWPLGGLEKIGGISGLDPLVEELITTDLDPNEPNEAYISAIQQTILGIQILGDGQVMRKSSVGAPTFDILEDTQHIFIEPANDGEFTDTTFTTHNKFHLMDSYGNRLFYAFEKRKRGEERGCCSLDSPLNVAIVGGNGVESMALSGTTRTLSLRESENGLCGYVQERTTSCPPTTTSYDIKDKHGNLCFKIIPEDTSSSAQFEVFGVDMLKIGHVGKFWGHLPDSPVDMSHSYGISFPNDMNTREKALMLGAVIPIYWKYYADKSRTSSRLACAAWSCLCLWILLLLLAIFGFSLLATYIIRPS